MLCFGKEKVAGRKDAPKTTVFGLSYTEREAVILHVEDEHTIKRPISTEIFVVSEKGFFRSLVLSLPFEIDYTIIGSRRLHLWKY